MIGNKVAFKATIQGVEETFLRQGTVIDKVHVFISEKYMVMEHTTNKIFQIPTSEVKQILNEFLGDIKKIK